MDHASGASPRAGGPVDVVGGSRFHPAEIGAHVRCGLGGCRGSAATTGRLTPVRVHRVVSALLVEMGTPAKPPKPCGRSPGRPKGRLSGRAKRYPALKKGA